MCSHFAHGFQGVAIVSSPIMQVSVDTERGTPQRDFEVVVLCCFVFQNVIVVKTTVFCCCYFCGC